MRKTWVQRVAVYLDDLQRCTETIEWILENTRVQTVAVQEADVKSATEELIAALQQLEAKIGEREELLRANDAPQAGLTLTEKLQQVDQIDHLHLATRCKEISRTIELVNQRAVSLFVCQYNLAELTGHITRLLTGATAPATYGADNNRNTSGGGLFNEAA